MLPRPFKAPLSVVFDAATQIVDMIHAAPSFDRALEEVDEVRPFTDFRPSGRSHGELYPALMKCVPQRGPHLDIGTSLWKRVLGMVSICTGRK